MESMGASSLRYSILHTPAERKRRIFTWLQAGQDKGQASIASLLLLLDKRPKRQDSMPENTADAVQSGGREVFILDVHFVSFTPVPSSWERRAPARLQKPHWSVALPGKTLENWP
jgi:hypothetical protein